MTQDIPTTAEVQRGISVLQPRLQQHPLTQRYAKARAAGGAAFRHTEPWTAHGERLLVATALITDMHGAVAMDERLWEHLPSEMHARFGYATALSNAATYLWSTKTREIARRLPLPRHSVGRGQMPHPVMFWSLEDAMSITHYDDKSSEQCNLNWLLIAEADIGIHFIMDATSLRGDHQWVTGGSIGYGEIYPDAFVDQNKNDVATWILASLAFLQTPVVQHERLPRMVRRELKRAHPYEKDTALTTGVILLRRLAPEQSRSAPKGQKAGPEHHNQWWVSGHIRAQWYPSIQGHKLIWIAPYLKGPEDKPLLVKTHVVNR